MVAKEGVVSVGGHTITRVRGALVSFTWSLFMWCRPAVWLVVGVSWLVDCLTGVGL